MIARTVLARMFAERSLGIQDPGATAVHRVIESFARHAHAAPTLGTS